MRTGHTFSYDEALATFPLVRELTAAAMRHLGSLTSTLNSREEHAAREHELEEAREKIFLVWRREIERLGCEVEGPWRVAFDSGHGFWSWSWPEEALAHHHAYDEDYEERLPVV